jgi:hypothetical protein
VRSVAKYALGVTLGLFGAGAVAAVGYVHSRISINLPYYSSSDRVAWLEQNWSAEQRKWFHHADQGAQSFLIPYEWFAALEQPVITLGETSLLSDPRYLDRLGFISVAANGRASDLPIGFARGKAMHNSNGDVWLHPQSKQPMTSIGLTCAACHTGRLTYQGTTVLIDGGSGLVDIGTTRQAVGLSVLFTKILPYRFDRFATRVIGPSASPEARAELRRQLSVVWGQMDKIRRLDDGVSGRSVVEGYGRLDAVTRIGNQVFGLDLKRDGNYQPTSAPVHFPRLWNTSWYDWMHYNGSMAQPMARNAGQALGSAAMINLLNPKRILFESSLDVANIFEIEKLVAGKPPDGTRGFTGLTAPKWPADILPPIDGKQAAKGAELYKGLCQRCHLAPVTSPEFWNAEQWLPPNAAGERYLAIDQVSLAEIGTDPSQAEDQARRTVSTPAELGLASNKFVDAIVDVAGKAVARWYDGQTPPIQGPVRLEMNGYRENGRKAPLKYNARPLNGIWATPPYLHNGSVPNLYSLLSPVTERPAKFYVGNREYDPVNVGYRHDIFPGAPEIDTAIRGNHNTGHEFNDDARKQGVIGRRLSPDERRAVVEYLKTL